MRLADKWLFGCLGLGLYAAGVGGLAYYGWLERGIEQRVKTEVLELVRADSPRLAAGLRRSPAALTLQEFDILAGLAADPRVASLLYLDRFGQVRWFKEAAFIGRPLDELTEFAPLPTAALRRALASRLPAAEEVAGLPFYEVAIPLSLRGELLGAVDLQLSREAARAALRKALGRYALGACVALLVLWEALRLYLDRAVLRPLGRLRDAVEGLSLRRPRLEFADRGDELGDLANALRYFLGRAAVLRDRAAGEARRRSAAERRWWAQLLKALAASGQRTLVVDADNSVLYTDLPGADRSETGRRPHLLDLVDGRHREVLRLAGAVRDRPDQVLETEARLVDGPCRVRAVHLRSGPEPGRTLILFDRDPAAS